MTFGEIKHLIDNEEKSKAIWKLEKKINYLKKKDKIVMCDNCGKELKYYSYKNHKKRCDKQQ
jgi:hypothetical protein